MRPSHHLFSLSLAVLACGVASWSADAFANKRGFGQGKYGLELDNVRCGWVVDV